MHIGGGMKAKVGGPEERGPITGVWGRILQLGRQLFMVSTSDTAASEAANFLALKYAKEGHNYHFLEVYN